MPEARHNPHDPGFRVGLGWDIHRLEPLRPSGKGRPLLIGGIHFDHDLGPAGHSDGDALLHALTDALLGAIGGPDIGELFPDTDPRWAGADSAAFVAEALRRVRDAGWQVVNVDAVVVLERPKLAPSKQAVRNNLARLLGLQIDRVNVKGKTHERIGPVGEGHAVEAHVVVLLSRAA
ncbi:MAG TPA: 2-C-methyl-D-erythritol 2,4-cyclodiphosphate synthase [Phycisphaerales bacterium]|nr:2-C-methyl-D-erythritol 2,4-cyclodiphosphate synthase [Phycisphaerales bacterium]